MSLVSDFYRKAAALRHFLGVCRQAEQQRVAP